MLKSHLKNFTPLKEMKLIDIITFTINQQDTRKIKPFNLENSDNRLIKKYLVERRDLISYLKRMTNQFKYTERTFYYTISIFDSIFAIIDAENLKIFQGLKIDVLMVSSLLIAGKIYKS